MFINDIHIIAYVIIGVAGLFTGFFAGWCNERLPEYKPVITTDIFLEYRTKLKPNYLLMILNAAIYVFLLYRFGIHTDLITNLPLLSYLILTPMLLSVFCIDYKLTIIPKKMISILYYPNMKLIILKNWIIITNGILILILYLYL